jgi:hypothetical protein
MAQNLQDMRWNEIPPRKEKRKMNGVLKKRKQNLPSVPPPHSFESPCFDPKLY